MSYLSKSSIAVTGNFRLKRALILTTLRIGPFESGQNQPSSKSGPTMEGLTRWLKLQRSPLPRKLLQRSRLRRRRSNEFLPRVPMLAVVSFRVIPAFLISALLSTSAAHAASITNRDDRDHKVTVIEGDAQKDHVLKPNEVLEGVCDAGCLVRLDDSRDEPFKLESTEVTSIEDGQLLSDEPEVPGDPEAGEAGQPSHPGSR